MKYAVILGDGMADYPVPELNGRTPLEVAEHPHMDALARNGEFGLVQTIPAGMKPGSDTANLAVFGYDPKVYYSGRSPLEACSMGIELSQADVTYRCNFVTLSDTVHPEDAVMTDYSAGEISSEEAAQLVACLNERLGTEAVHLYPGFSYRHCLVLRNAETGADLTPPHDISGQPVKAFFPKGTHAELLNGWMRTACEILPDHPVNRERVRQGKNPANAVWFWGEGRKPALTPFTEKTGLRGAVVSAVDLVQGIGVAAGMQVLKVPGATGTYETNFDGKAQAAIQAFRDGTDYVYVHLEAPDECGHHHQVKEKVWSIEQIDRRILAPIQAYLEESGEAYALLLLPDHPTPLVKMTHVSDPVPYVLYHKGNHAGRSGVRYTEGYAGVAGLLLPDGSRLIDRMLHMCCGTGDAAYAAAKVQRH